MFSVFQASLFYVLVAGQANGVDYSPLLCEIKITECSLHCSACGAEFPTELDSICGKIGWDWVGGGLVHVRNALVEQGMPLFS